MIHQYKLAGYNIVLDVCSGSVHVVDDAAYEIIGCYEGRSRQEVLALVQPRFPQLSREELDECYDQVAQLEQAVKLFTPDTFAPMA